jgi:hypothetical protein
MNDVVGSIGGFELRLLEELELLVEAPRPAVPPAHRRWLPRSRFVLALVVVALVVGATAASIGAWRLIAKDARKTAIVVTLQRGGHVGPLVTSSRGWSLYAHAEGRGRIDWELSSREKETVVGTFLGKHPIDLASVSGASGYEVLAGRVNAPGAASVALALPGRENLPVQLEGRLFLVTLSPGQRHPEAVLALDAAGRVVARARP